MKVNVFILYTFVLKFLEQTNQPGTSVKSKWKSMEDSAFTSSSLTKISVHQISMEPTETEDKINDIVLSNVNVKTDDLSKSNGAATIDTTNDTIESIDKIQSTNL